MKRRKYIIGMTLLLVCVIGASTINATVQLGETSDYDEENGKTIIVYVSSDKENITSIKILWWNLDNVSQYKEESYTYPGGIKYGVYHLKDYWNSSYILWTVEGTVMIGNESNKFYFWGEFSTISIKIQGIIDEATNSLTTWLLTNSTYKNIFESIGDKGVAELDKLISKYNTGIVAELKNIGLTDKQIQEIMTSVNEGFETTLASHKEQQLAIAQAEERAFRQGYMTIIYFVAAILIILLISLYFRGDISKIKNIGKRKNVTKSVGDTIDLSSFDF